MEPQILDQIPAGLLELPAHRLHEQLEGPTLIHLQGQEPRPLFISVLQHGNEISGWDALRQLLQEFEGPDSLPRSLALLIGNIRAAAQGRRFLPDQPDFNRCWPGHDGPAGPVHRLFARIVEYLREQRPVACIDIHNNSGDNPHYTAVNHVQPYHLRLAAHFSPTVLYFDHPRGTQSAALGEFFPAVTLECGPPNRAAGAEHALAYLRHMLDHWPHLRSPQAASDVDLLRMAATVTVNPDCSLSFDPQSDADIVLRKDLEQLNFLELEPGTVLGRINRSLHEPLREPLLVHRHEADGQDGWFRIEGDQIVVARPLRPVMLTTDVLVVHQDCLCHLLEPIQAPWERPQTGRDDEDAPSTGTDTKMGTAGA